MSNNPTEQGYTHDPIRARIERIGPHLSLPLASQALGCLEGEHESARYGHSFDFLDLRAYNPGDDAGSIDWKASARAGRPIVVEHASEANATTWLLLDTSRQMDASSESGEPILDIAANALRMFAVLTLRRSDDISLVFADAKSISRHPFTGGYQKFDTTFSKILKQRQPERRNFKALLEYASQIRDKEALVVIATDDSAVDSADASMIQRISQNHPLVFISVIPLNPFNPALGKTAVYDSTVGNSTAGKRIPAFLKDQKIFDALELHRESSVAVLAKELAQWGDHLLRGRSSEEMLDNFLGLVSFQLNRSSTYRRYTATSQLSTAQNGSKR